MPRRSVVLVILLVWVYTVGGRAQSVVRVDSLSSDALQKTQRYAVLLPAEDDSSRRYPVLYLLHGYAGNHLDWSKRTRLAEYVRGWPLIVVMPEAGNSWYVNARSGAGCRYEDFMISDLPRHVQERYNVDTLCQGIAGLSMGGYGAVMLALRHPGRYRLAGSLSGAVAIPREIDEMQRATWGRSIGPSVLAAFGQTPGDFRDEHDLFLLFRNTAKAGAPYLYLVAGIQDEFPTFLPAHRALADSLRSVGAAYEYHELPGKHNWQFWDAQLPGLLARLRAVLEF